MPRWIRIHNRTRGTVLPVQARWCAAFLCRLRGLMFRRRLPSDEALLLVGIRESRAEAAIHMLFVFFPIAVIWLDRAGRVVDTVLARPFRLLYAPRAPARDILEGPPELLHEVSVGDLLEFVDREG